MINQNPLQDAAEEDDHLLPTGKVVEDDLFHQEKEKIKENVPLLPNEFMIEAEKPIPLAMIVSRKT